MLKKGDDKAIVRAKEAIVHGDNETLLRLMRVVPEQIPPFLTQLWNNEPQRKETMLEVLLQGLLCMEQNIFLEEWLRKMILDKKTP